MNLNDEQYKTIIKGSPLASIDLIVRDKQERILLGYRRNSPAKNAWFVPGGRMRKGDSKGESIEEALARLIKVELGQDHEKLQSSKRIRFRGVFEHLYEEENYFDEPGYGTQYVVLAFDVEASPKVSALPTEQHSEYRWFSIDELLRSTEVHSNTKLFFRPHALSPDPGIYRALMSHYLHYEGQMWGRTQLLLIIQGAALVVAYQFRGSYLSPILMIGAAIVLAAIWRLIELDKGNRDENIPVMDSLARLLIPSPLKTRPVSVRASVGGLLRLFRGKYVLRIVFSLLILLDLALFGTYIFWEQAKGLFPALANGG